ncbi:hypothetical protein J5X84_15805 [Streptosporangiaceae bacterium NEAU-GS5]|nr:hypothetical protein [Streptosporangiaceae bacterium NEAU-GS5]
MRKKTSLIKLMLTVGLLAPLSFMSASPAQADAQRYTTVQFWANNNPCLDVQRESREEVQLWECNGQPQQQWNAIRLDPLFYGPNPYGLDSFAIVNKLDGKCLTGTDVAPDIIRVQPCTFAANQIWWNVDDRNIGSPPSGWMALMQNKAFGGCLAPRNFDTVNGTRVVGHVPGVTGCGDKRAWWLHMLA